MAWPENGRHSRPENLNRMDGSGFFTHILCPLKCEIPYSPVFTVFFIQMKETDFFTQPYVGNNINHITRCIILVFLFGMISANCDYTLIVNEQLTNRSLRRIMREGRIFR